MNRDDMARPFAKADARLTAYALDELSQTERADVQNELARSCHLRSEVKAIRGVAAQLRRELAHASKISVGTDFGDLQPAGPARPDVQWPNRKAFLALAVAASIIAILGWGIWQGAPPGNHPAQAASLQARAPGFPTPSLHYDLPDAELRLVLMTGSPRLAYDSPVHVANERLLNFTVGYQRDF